MKLKDFKNFIYPSVILDEIFLLNEFYEGDLSEISLQEIADRSGLTLTKTEQLLGVIAQQEADLFADHRQFSQALLLDMRIAATAGSTFKRFHQLEFNDVVALIKHHKKVFCLSDRREHAFSAALALRLKGYAHVFADTIDR